MNNKNCVRHLLMILAFCMGNLTGLRAESVILFAPAVFEVTENAGPALAYVWRTNDIQTEVSVTYSGVDLTALAGSDFVQPNGILVFAPGETNKPIAVEIINDGLIEPIEAFRVAISSPSVGAVLGTRVSALVRITDNDVGMKVEFSAYTALENSGSVFIGVTRGTDGNTPVSVDYSTSDGTALADLDYARTSGKLEFSPSEEVKLVEIPILNDGLKEVGETFRFALANASGTILNNPNNTTITIIDNDPGVQFEFNRYWAQENEGEKLVKVLRGNDRLLGAFSVNLSTEDLAALKGLDYVEVAKTLNFAEGEMEKMVSLPVLPDDLVESNEDYRLMLANPTGEMLLGTNSTSTNFVLDITGMVPHRFGGIRVGPDGKIEIPLEGALNQRFASHFDLYHIEASENLVDWVVLPPLAKLNPSDTEFMFRETVTGGSRFRFYRIATNHLITPLLMPTGAYAVGTVTRWLTDPSRRNRHEISTNSAFKVKIWYPAQAVPGKLPSWFEEPSLVNDVNWQGHFFNRAPYSTAHAVEHAPFLNVGPCPVILYSHGHGGGAVEIAEKAQDLASHGHVVIALDHADSTAVVLQDGTRHRTPLRPASFEGRLRDLRFVVKQLEQWAQSDELFKGRLDLERLGAMGFSYGGGSAGEFCRSEPRCKAAVFLDPTITDANLLQDRGLRKPSVSAYRPDRNQMVVFDSSTAGSLWFQISGTEHGNYFDYYWWVFSEKMEIAREDSRVLNLYIRWFFNRHLLGSQDPMPSSADFPRVINFRSK